MMHHHATDTSLPTTNNTAMSLWHKFATWQQEMDQCRTLVRTVVDEQEQIRTQLKDLLRIREEEERKIEAMEAVTEVSRNTSHVSELPSLDRYRELQCKLDTAETQYRTAKASFETCQQNVQHQKHIRHDILREFIKGNSKFHWQCRRAQYDLAAATAAATRPTECIASSSLVAEGTSGRVQTLHAVLCAKAVEPSSCHGTSMDDHWMAKTIKELQNNIALEKSTWIDADECLDENDPTVWKVSREKDLELNRSVELYQQQLEKYTRVEQETEQLQTKRDMLHTKGLDRDRRMKTLQTQLQRLQNDCTNMESEIDQCQELTLEDESLAHTYRSSTFPCVLFSCWLPFSRTSLLEIV